MSPDPGQPNPRTRPLLVENNVKGGLTTNRAKPVTENSELRRIRTAHPACLQPPSRRRRCRSASPPDQHVRRHRRRDPASRQRSKGHRLLLRRDRHSARHHPACSTATLCPLMSSSAKQVTFLDQTSEIVIA